MANLIRLKQLDQADLSGFFNDAFVNTGLASKTYVDRFSDQTVSGIKTFENGINLDNIDNLNLSGVDITITSGNVVLTNPLSAPNVVYNTGNQTISGTKTIGNLNTANLFFQNNTDSFGITTQLQDGDLFFSNKIGGIFAITNLYASPYTGLNIIETTPNNTTIKLPPNKNDFIAMSSEVVYNTGAQNISGVKTFIDSGIFSNGGVSAVPLLNNPLSIVGSGTGYIQVNIQNRGTGLTATADLVITANNGTDNSNFINLGINNSGYSDPLFNNTTGLDGYLIMDGGDLDIGTRTPGKIIEFHAGGTTESNVIARINQNGLAMVSGYVLNTVNAGVIAGTNAQGQGSLTSQVNIIITNPNNPGGVTLPTSPSGFSSRIMVRNTAANPVNVYPANGARIDASGINFSGAYLIQNAQKEFYSVGTGQWYSI